MIRGRVRARAALVLLLMCAGSACKETDGLRVESLEFDGVEQVPESELRAALATQAGSWIPFSKEPPFDREAFAADLRRIDSFYESRGYPDARVTHVDVELDAKGERVSVTVQIEEGAPVRIASVAYEGFDGLPERLRERLPRRLGLREGEVRSRAAVTAARESALDTLKEHGFPWAAVEVRERPAGPRQLALRVLATPGPRATFGDIEIRGNASVGDHVIRRQLTFSPGDPYRQSRVRESQRRFSTLGLFDFAYVEPRGREEQPPQVPMRITVAEAKHRRFTAAAGYGSEDKVRARARWEHVNFFGGARTAAVEGKWSSLDRGARLEFAEPWFFSRHLAFSAQALAWNEAERVYRRDTFGGRATVRWQRDRRNPIGRRGATSTLGLTFINELTDYEVDETALADPEVRDSLIALGLDPETGSARGTLSALRLEFDHRTVQSALDPRRGYSITGAVERAGGFLPGDFTYTEVSGEGRVYVPLGRRWIFAQRVRAATIDARDPGDAEPGSDALDTTVPFFKRYFLGGSTSLRGWGRYEVSPLTDSGYPIGGLTLLELSSELRLPITGKLSAVAFVDAGNVWRESWAVGDGALRASVGPGVRYDTPIGPVRLDLGYQLNPIPGLRIDGEPERRRWRVHISIGQAF
jgi:outer membrane protein insertion porin family/translocation and assembly module TamA